MLTTWTISSVALSSLRVGGLAGEMDLWLDWWKIVNWQYVSDVFTSNKIPSM